MIVAQQRRRSQAERTETTKKLILEQAYRLFGKSGYSKTSVDDIAVKCGLTRGALYHHFNGKKELFATLCFDVEQEMQEAIASASGKTPKDKFNNSIDIFFDYCANADRKNNRLKCESWDVDLMGDGSWRCGRVS